MYYREDVVYNTNYLISESEIVTGKSQTEALPYRPSEGEVIARSIQ